MTNKWIHFAVLFLLVGLLSAQETIKREKYIYVPYQDWNQVWQGQKKVKLTQQQYQELIKKQPYQAVPPQDIVMKNASYRGRVHENTLIFDVRIEIESLVSHRTFCDFTFGEYGLTQAKLNDKEAPLFLQRIVDNPFSNNENNDFNRNFVQQAQQIDQAPENERLQYRLLIPNKGSHVFTMKCHLNMESKRDVLSANIVLGDFPQQTFYLDTSNENTYETNPAHHMDEDKDLLTIHLQKKQDIYLTVKPKEKRDEKEALLLVDITSSHLIKLDAIKSRFVINLNVRHRKLKTFQFLIPERLYLLNISENRWDMKETNKGKILTIQLEKELLGNHNISINAETQLLEHGKFILPKIVATSNYLFRQTGLVYIENNRDVKLELVETKETRQLDQHTTANNYRNFKTRSKKQKRGDIHAFGQKPFITMKAWNENYEVKLDKSPIKQAIESDVAIGISFYPDGLELVAHVNFTVIEGEAKQLSIKLPKGWVLTNMNTFLSMHRNRFRSINSDNYYVKENVLYIPLKNKLKQGHVFKASVTLQNLKRMEKGTRYIDLPLVVPQNVKYLPSFLGIIAHQDYKITARDFKDLSSVDLKIIRSINIDSKDLKQGYKIHNTDAKGTIEIEQKKPQTSVLATHYISIQPEKITYATTLVYSVKSASVNSFRFAMPKEFTGILNISDGRRVSLIKEKKDYIEKDLRVWQVDAQKRIIGNYSLYLTYEIPLTQQTEKYKFLPILFYDVDYIKGFVGIQKNSRLEVEKSTKNLEEAPANEMPLFAHPKFISTTDFSYVAKYTKEDYELSLDIGVHDKATTAPAVLENVVIRSIFPGNGMERVECIYKLKHLGEQFFNVELPSKANFWAVVVNNKGERPLRNNNTIAIPIPPNSGHPINIRVMYERPAPKLETNKTIKLTRPQTNAKIPVLSLVWQVYLPKEYQILSGVKQKLDVPWYEHGSRILKRLYQHSKSITVSYPETSSNSSESRYYDPAPQQQKSARYPKLRSKGKKKYSSNKPRKTQNYRRQETSKRNETLRKYAEKQRVIQDLEKSVEEEQRLDFDNNESPSDAPDNEIAEEWGNGDDSFGDDAGSGEEFDEGNFGGDSWGQSVQEDKKAEKERSELFGERYKNKDSKNDSNIWQNQPQEKKPIGNIMGKKGLKNIASVETLKAKGLRSMDIELNTYETTLGVKATAPTTRSLDIEYSKTTTFRSLIIGLMVASMAFFLLIFSQHKLPRLPIVFTLLLCATFAPMWFGNWLMPYCNAFVLGLFMSLILYMLGGIMRFTLKITKGIGAWFGLQAALVLICLFVGSNVSYAQQDVRHIYIPYSPEEISKVQDSKDIFLSYNEYTKLWNAAHPKHEQLLQQKLPNFALYNARYDGKIVNDQVVFSAKINVEVFKAPANIEVGLANTSVTSASLQSQTQKTTLAIDAYDEGYRLVIPSAGIYTVDLEFIPHFEIGQKRGKMSIDIANIPTTQIDFHLEKDMDVDLQNFKGGWYEKTEEQQKIITLFPKNQKNIQLLWYESSERYRAKGLNISATSVHQLKIHDNILQLQSNIAYKVASGECEELAMKLPQNYKIIDFGCTNLESWVLTKELDHNLIKVRLANKQYRNLNVFIIAEKRLDSMEGKHFYPEIQPLGVNRENGHATITYQDPYKVLVTNQSQVRKVNSKFVAGKFSEVFRYNQHPFSLEFSVMKEHFNNTTKSTTVVAIEKDKVNVELNTELEVKGKQTFRYHVLLGKNWQVNKVQQSKRYKGGITNWRLADFDEKHNILEITFYRSIKKDGKMNMYISLESEYETPFSLPVFRGQNIAYESGTIVVASSEDLELHTSDIKGIQQIDATKTHVSDRTMVKRFAYRYQDTIYEGKIHIESRKADVSVKSVVNLLVENDWINFGYFLNFDIKYAGVDSFNFRLPKLVGEDVEVLGENIREKRVVVTEKYISVMIKLHNKIKGLYQLSVFPNIVKNKGTGIVFTPMVFPDEIKNQTHIVVQNQSQYEISEQTMKGVSPTSIHQVAFLPPQTRKTDFIRAYKVNLEDWELTFSENKQKIEHSVHAVIDAIKIDSVVQKPGNCYHRVVFNLRHSGLQFLELEKDPRIRIWGVFVAGRFVRPSQKQEQGKEIILIPLYQTGHKEQKISIRILYDEKIPDLAHKTSLAFVSPKVRNIDQINEVYWVLHAPKDFLYRYGGNVSKVNKRSFSAYAGGNAVENSLSSDENRRNINKALANSNAIKKRQDQWFKRQQMQQNMFFERLQDSKQQLDLRQNRLNMDSIQQYGADNLEAAQRVRRGSKKKIVLQKKTGRLAGENQSLFVKNQNKILEVKARTQQFKKQQQLAVSFNFDIKKPGNLQKAYFTKKQGNAKLEVFCYKQPREDKLWVLVQFIGLLFLIVCASVCKIFSLKNYSFRRFVLTIVIICGVIFMCAFPAYIHYIYV
ncbi:hypothetical protein [Candidatus Uabimicrobium sp. HlEnr_7]|uniref:hypothetical protein n=1 Tax=Candidatus Uabimicrobium helgolandensis TaxID=3095367 RepID=UPI00355824CF